MTDINLWKFDRDLLRFDDEIIGSRIVFIDHSIELLIYLIVNFFYWRLRWRIGLRLFTHSFR